MLNPSIFLKKNLAGFLDAARFFKKFYEFLKRTWSENWAEFFENWQFGQKSVIFSDSFCWLDKHGITLVKLMAYCNSLLFNMWRIIILGKIKAMFQKIYFRNVIAIVLVLPNVFWVDVLGYMGKRNVTLFND